MRGPGDGPNLEPGILMGPRVRYHENLLGQGIVKTKPALGDPSILPANLRASPIPLQASPWSRAVSVWAGPLFPCNKSKCPVLGNIPWWQFQQVLVMQYLWWGDFRAGGQPSWAGGEQAGPGGLSLIPQLGEVATLKG